MYGSTIAKVVWTLVPVISLSVLSPVPFVVAAVKGVIAWWLAGVYIAATVTVLTVVTILPEGNPFAGLLLILLLATAATHAALLDNPKISLGK
jgi:hypothetical protein